MAPVETHTVLVHRGPFDAESRKYPVFNFFEQYVAWFDDREHDAAGLEDFHTGQESLYSKKVTIMLMYKQRTSISIRRTRTE